MGRVRSSVYVSYRVTRPFGVVEIILVGESTMRRYRAAMSLLSNSAD